LALSIGIIYLWFGTLKYFPNTSPADDLVKNTIDMLSFNLIPSNVSIILLAIWESLVGLLLITNVWRQTAIIIALVHMAFTFSPLFLFPDQIFENIPFHLTLLGQYILKNLIIVASLVFLYKLPTTTKKDYQQ
jgi:uncharacterized membrane protein YkgB